MPKTEFDYAAKQESRQRLVNFVIRNYPHKERRGLKVACLPGAQAQDVYRITDVLGVPRENVWGLERDREVYKALESKNLGINLFQGTDKEFFKDTDKKFDVVSLDYFGQIKRDEIDSLGYLFGREILKPRGVLHTNFYGSREHGKVKEIYQTGSAFKASLAKLRDKPLEEINEIIEQGRLGNIIERGVEEYMVGIKGLREGLTRAIMTVAGVGKFNLKTEDMDKILHYDFEDVKKLTDSGISLHLAYYLTYKENKSYFCDCVERYKYISDDGSPMLTDIFLFNQHREWFDDKKYPITLDSSDSERPVVKINDSPIIATDEMMDSLLFSRGKRRKSGLINEIFTPLERRILAQANNVYDYSGRLRETDIIRDRQFLGSSRKIEKELTEAPKYNLPKETTKGSLTRERAIELLRDGKSPEWIAKTYGGNVNQFRAYKAWITMGKY